MRVAIVHDWLTGMRGGERCLEAFLCIYPDAHIFTLIHVPGSTSPEIDRRVVGTSFLSSLPGIRRYYRALLPFFPLAARQLDLSGYDLVVSLSHAAAKNVTIPHGVPHVCYCFTPMRYVWDQVPYYFGRVGRLLMAPLLSFLRGWDRRGAKSVTHFVAISSFVGARIRLFYSRRSVVIPPPVRMASDGPREVNAEEQGTFRKLPESFFLCAGALVPYKRVAVAVKAFATLDAHLLVVGAGPELATLKKIATPNVHFLGAVPDRVLWECYRRCSALIFPGIEDFGLVPVECLASGRPVIGVNAGGLRQSMAAEGSILRSSLVSETPYGVLLSKRGYGRPEAIVEAVETFLLHQQQFSPQAAVRQASNFSYKEFFKAWSLFCQQTGLYAGGDLHLIPGSEFSSEESPPPTSNHSKASRGF
jgi:glycosyltransferase involved in cell wall biosynthesis